ncbi:C-type lectin [Elysia marginata]|uniref:C-type lectin n=1 Tax=Elysia marginata TaxID=1093978 RepID=A0AAV4JXZ6_9GAST|nr:C-type lectin [Elysia marginata]
MLYNYLWSIENFLFNFSYLILISEQAFSVKAALSNYYFKVNSDVQCRKAELSPPWTSESLVSCVAECRIRFHNRCNNIVYNNLTSACTPVHPMAFSDPVLASQPGDELFSLQDKELTCDVSAGFQLQQACGASACIRRTTAEKDFEDALDDCKSRGATLFSPDTYERFALLPNIATSDQQTWVGLKKPEPGFDWKWPNGNLILQDFFDFMWSPYQPSHDLSAEKCISYLFKDTSACKLHDLGCSRNIEFICEQN